MRLRRHTTVRITLVDNSVVSGVVAWSWRWRVVRLVAAYQLLPQGVKAAADGPVLIPHRSIMYAMEVQGVSDE